MICAFCTKPITGSQLQDCVKVRIRWVAGLDPAEFVFGDVPGAFARQDDATAGPLAHVLHKKCWLARQRRDQLRAAKEADPSAQPGEGADWREPVTAELEDMQPHGNEGHGDHRGA